MAVPNDQAERQAADEVMNERYISHSTSGHKVSNVRRGAARLRSEAEELVKVIWETSIANSALPEPPTTERPQGHHLPSELVYSTSRNAARTALQGFWPASHVWFGEVFPDACCCNWHARTAVTYLCSKDIRHKFREGVFRDRCPSSYKRYRKLRVGRNTLQ